MMNQAPFDWDTEEGQRCAVYSLVYELGLPEKRGSAMQELCRVRDKSLIADILAPILWYSFGAIASLLQEIISIYPYLMATKLPKSRTGHVCNAVSLLQAVAQHSETRIPFFKSNILLYLYPLLNTSFKQKALEYMRLTSLGVVGALVKIDQPEVINFLLQTELIPLCLRIMEQATDLSKTLATFILQKILLDDVGLNYICSVPKRFRNVTDLLSSMVANILQSKPNSVEGLNDQRPRLIKHIVRCYLRLSDQPSFREELKKCLPKAFTDGSLTSLVKDEPNVAKWMHQLIVVSENGNIQE